MGLCCCTFMAPVGACIGFWSPYCCTIGMTQESKARLRYPFLALLFIGCLVFYPLLTIMCARYDGVDWTFYPQSGSCWSEGGGGPYKLLGIATGLFIGMGILGALMSQILYCRHREDDSDEEEGKIWGNGRGAIHSSTVYHQTKQ